MAREVPNPQEIDEVGEPIWLRLSDPPTPVIADRPFSEYVISRIPGERPGFVARWDGRISVTFTIEGEPDEVDAVLRDGRFGVGDWALRPGELLRIDPGSTPGSLAETIRDGVCSGGFSVERLVGSRLFDALSPPDEPTEPSNSPALTVRVEIGTELDDIAWRVVIDPTVTRPRCHEYTAPQSTPPGVTGVSVSVSSGRVTVEGGGPYKSSVATSVPSWSNPIRVCAQQYSVTKGGQKVTIKSAKYSLYFDGQKTTNYS